MSVSPSFERIDYQLRYNKHIERKLIFDVLAHCNQLIGFERHQYIGFGSMWFADFRLAHRVLGMNRMMSMERAQHADRAKFNSPYYTIEVKGGDSSESLKEVDWSVPIISWLDYDGALNPQISNDLKYVLQNCQVDSIVMITLNASRATYRPKGLSGPRDRKQTALGQVEAMLMPGVVPARFEPITKGANHGDVSAEEFPEFLAEALLSYMTHLVNSGGGQGNLPGSAPEAATFLPLFNLCHKDGAEMITVGGAITGNSKIARNEKVVAFAAQIHANEESLVCEEAEKTESNCIITDGNKVEHEKTVNAEPKINRTSQRLKHLRLDLVPLTLKEKLVLDSCLPDPKSKDFIARAVGKGVHLGHSELEKYWRHYRHFPVFFETPI